MRLSIIIPVYNEGPYLRRCLNSIKLTEGVEVIAVDDKSTDDSLEILKDYEFKICENDENKGVSYSRNKGMYYASGEYITFLDADDALAPDAVENILKVIEGHPNENVIQLNHRRCHNEGCKVERRYSARQGFHDLKNLPPKWAPVWNKIYKSEFLMYHNIKFPEGQQFDEDRFFNIRCLKYTGGVYFDERVALHKYFDNEASLCHTVDKSKMQIALCGLALLLGRNNPPELDEVIRQSIIMHLNSKKYRLAFGG